MRDVRGEKLKEGQPVYYMYYGGRVLTFGVISHFTKEGVTIKNSLWDVNLRDCDNRLIGLDINNLTSLDESKLKVLIDGHPEVESLIERYKQSL